MKKYLKNFLKKILPDYANLKVLEIYLGMKKFCAPTSFDLFMKAGQNKCLLTRYQPRYPFALDRGNIAKQLFHEDPNNRFGHEPELAHLIDLLLPDDGSFFDIGANHGYFTVFVAVRAKFIGHVFSFEPVSNTFKFVKRLVDELQISDKVKLFNAGLSDQVGKATISWNTDLGLASFNINSNNHAHSEEAELITLDSLGVSRCDFLKIDTEGLEYKVIKGGLNTIQKYKPFIFLESTLSAGSSEQRFDAQALLPLFSLREMGYSFFLPAWRQSNGALFVGIGSNFEMKDFALIPFDPEERMCFPGEAINIFCAHNSRLSDLGIHI